ncbi:CPXCG motif-containing cysteine-rich protein [Shewanella sp. NIFS-20-20]|uniref:CPXCG motif-containing cysteine-rich protein n=1 Tax=Shewanella sp. NIFS-20-20 TaxID=2853806 RepID=UPI001C454AF9|nr:CPXCG motif-containing cysteine-rich protein [Shewanella sp. NIFS-20-20]MBV7316874.1 CPXCG motif-containing cysteine-rich protein [Shewanella sp. NIFS-20-20]
MKLKKQIISCPHCGHHLHIDVDMSQGDQDYYDDCRVCCHPIHFNLHVDEVHRTLELHVSADDD